MQEAGVGLEHADITFRGPEFRPALSDLFGAEGLRIQTECLRALLSIANEVGVLRPQIEDAARLKQFLAGLLNQRIPQRLGA